MPVDLYQWEVNGGLVHHCPKCEKPLTTPQARSRCVGQHVEWCKRYHTQLFKKGTSGQCAPCRNGDEQHQRRHREIAELVHKLALLNPTATTSTPITTPGLIGVDEEATPSPKTKKERKAVKKAKKISEMPKAINASNIEQVGKILHPNDYDDDVELELKLLNDPDIMDNRFFHKGTSNKREIRNEFVKKDRKGDKVVFRVGAQEMEGLLQLLDVSPVTNATSTEEKKLIEELKQKIEKDLVQAQQEKEELMMRKAGFWRWASKKAYNRLVANGRIWENKDDFAGAKSDESVGSTEGDTGCSTTSGTDDTDITEPDTDGADGAAAALEDLMLTTPTVPKTPAAPGIADEDWTSVSKKKGPAKGKKKETPKMTIKLTSNNGLANLVQSSTPRTTSFLRHYSEDD